VGYSLTLNLPMCELNKISHKKVTMPHFSAELEQVMTWKTALLQKMIQETAHVRASTHENT